MKTYLILLGMSLLFTSCGAFIPYDEAMDTTHNDYIINGDDCYPPEIQLYELMLSDTEFLSGLNPNPHRYLATTISDFEMIKSACQKSAQKYLDKYLSVSSDLDEHDPIACYWADLYNCRYLNSLVCEDIASAEEAMVY